MKTKLSVLLAALFIVGSVNVAFAQPPQGGRPQAAAQPEGVTANRDLAYVAGGHERQKLDLFIPQQGSGPFPLVVWIHGGGWAGGDKGGCPPLRGGYTDRGYAVASLNYRLSGDAIFPAQIEDCKAAIRWLRAHAGDYNLDPDHVGVWGSSAGGHLVALLGTSGHVKEFDVGAHLDQSSRVQAVCDYFGPTDLLQMDAHAIPGARLKHDAPGSPESRLIGGAIQENKAQTARANPIEYLTKEAPPYLIVHGDQDPAVPHHQSTLLFDALTKIGVPARFITVEGGGHGQGFPGAELDPIVAEFFNRHLKGDASAAAWPASMTSSVKGTAPAAPSGGANRPQPAAAGDGPRRPGLSFEQIRAREDANGDGRVTREEFKGPPPLFNRLDRNRDGSLTKEDFDVPAPQPNAAPTPGQARNDGQPNADLPVSTGRDISYGAHPRNVLDFWQAKSDKPTPLALFIHGGGFIGGSKDQISPAVLKAVRKNAEIAALSLISKDAPSILMSYAMAPGQAYPGDEQQARNWKIHHVVHGVELKKLCENLGVECHLSYPGATSAYRNAAAFLKAKLQE
ncbi:MAG: alpha/beta hydrolase fold domain-containing protein [Planctomycetes bacterium]|nr:alpha/beta hydrolase fold domain-containing protein [Planctomycetota bacterium]